MAIRWAEDLGAPAVVAGAYIVSEPYQPTWTKPLGIGLAALGLGLNYMRVGGQFTKNMGIAAMPWAMTSIYDYIRGGIGVPTMSGRLVSHPAARLGTSTVVSPAYSRESETVSIITP
jgi:hypothetical protein